MSDDRDALAALIRDAIDARYNDAAAPYDSAYLMDGDTLDSQFIEGHVDLLNIADAILARWRLVPNEPDTRCTSVYDMLWRCELPAGHDGPHEG